jgi:tetratricopeptide (TPR) repeat protein
MNDATHTEGDRNVGVASARQAGRYSAFISYNNKDRKWASWLHRQLETYRVPKHLVGRETAAGRLQRRLRPVFQDREELASGSDLGASLRAALAEAHSLIVICSPNSARSRWVNEEIKTFVALGRADRIACVIVGGRPYASQREDADSDLECFPPAVIEELTEPIAADLRAGGDGKAAAKLKLLAGVLDVGYDELRQREAARRQRQLVAISGASMAGVVLTSGLAVAAILSRNEAVRQRQTAERTVEFVKSIFEVSDPSEAKGATITAREILDRGARQIEGELNEEPSVKTELSVTLGEVYMGLGLYRQGEALVRGTFRIPGRDRDARVRQQTALGDVQAKQSDFADAAKSYGAALAEARKRDSHSQEMVPRILVGLGEAQSSNDDFVGARRSLAEALSLDVARLGPDHPDVARDLETQGLNAIYEGKLDEAAQLYARALKIRQVRQGKRHPKVAEDLNQLGTIAYLRRDGRTAETYWRRVLAANEAVLGPMHPDLATTLNNIGRVLLERRAFRDADGIYERSLAITLKERDETFEDLAFTFANLALVKKAMGQPAEAETLFRKALKAARLHHHRNLAPIMTDLADLLCTEGRGAEATTLLINARPTMAQTYPDDPWRVAWIDNVEGGCRLAQHRPVEARKLLETSQPVLAKRWSPDTLYGYEAQERLRRLAAEGRKAGATG